MKKKINIRKNIRSNMKICTIRSTHTFVYIAPDPQQLGMLHRVADTKYPTNNLFFFIITFTIFIFHRDYTSALNQTTYKNTA